MQVEPCILFGRLITPTPLCCRCCGSYLISFRGLDRLFLDCVKSISTCMFSFLMMDKSRMCRPFLFFFLFWEHKSYSLDMVAKSQHISFKNWPKYVFYSHTGKYFNFLFMERLHPVSFVFTENCLIRFQY